MNTIAVGTSIVAHSRRSSCHKPRWTCSARPRARLRDHHSARRLVVANASLPAAWSTAAATLASCCQQPAARLERFALAAGGLLVTLLAAASLRVQAWSDAAAERLQRVREATQDSLVAKLLVNLLAVVAVTLGDAVPLLNIDLRSVGVWELERLDCSHLLGTLKAAVPVQPNPFLMSMMPFITARLLLSGFTMVPGFSASVGVEMQSLEGQRNLQFGAQLLGVFIALVMAHGIAVQLHTLLPIGVHVDVVSTTFALCAGSCIYWWIAQLIDQHGLGSGTSFMYMMLISKGITSRFVEWLPQQVVAASSLAQSLAITAAVVVACVALTTAKVPVQLTPLSVSSTGRAVTPLRADVNEHSPDRLHLLLVPNITMVLLGYHFCLLPLMAVLPAMPNWWQFIANTLMLSVFNAAFTGTEAQDMQKHLQQVDLGIPGLAPGDATRNDLHVKLVSLRLIGGALLGLLLTLSSLAGDYLTKILGAAHIEFYDIVLVTSCICGSLHLAERSLAASREFKHLKQSVALITGASSHFSVKPT